MKKRICLFLCALILLNQPAGHCALATKKTMPEFPEGPEWVNSKPLKRQDILGKVVLVHFWTSTSIESLRDIRMINKWHSKYKTEGLAVIGVHIPQFDFEKNSVNILPVLKMFAVKHPIILDNESLIGLIYDNLSRPAHYLIDARGRIRYVYPGETDYGKQEFLIQDLLNENGNPVKFELEQSDTSKGLDKIRTPELYLGYKRISSFGNDENLKAEIPQRFSLPSFIRPDAFYLKGKWQITPERLKLLESGGMLVTKYSASSVYLVAGSSAKMPIQAEIKLDNRPLAMENAGYDVSAREDRSVITIGGYRLYHLIDTGESYGEHLLEITFSAPGAELFLVSFGGTSPFQKRKDQPARKPQKKQTANSAKVARLD